MYIWTFWHILWHARALVSWPDPRRSVRDRAVLFEFWFRGERAPWSAFFAYLKAYIRHRTMGGVGTIFIIHFVYEDIIIGMVGNFYRLTFGRFLVYL